MPPRILAMEMISLRTLLRSHRRLGPLLEAEPSGQLRGRHARLLRLVLQRLQRQAPDGPGDAYCAGDASGEVVHGHGDAAQLGVELAVVEGDPFLAHLLELAQ